MFSLKLEVRSFIDAAWLHLMASRGSKCSRLVFLLLVWWLGCPFGGVFTGGMVGSAFAQGAPPETSPNPSSRVSKRLENPPYRRDDLTLNWNQRGRTVPGESAASLRLQAHRQKMAMRAKRAAASRAESSPGLNSGSSPAVWQSVGPAPLASDATGNGMQDYNWVSGRATSVLIDPADSTGNTVLLGGAYGGLWRSTNAGSMSSNPASVTWQPLIDNQPTLAVGAISLQPNNSNLILVGTGETNSSGDSYYGLGILRSADRGLTWNQITGLGAPEVHDKTFLGVGFSKIAFSTATPNLVVAATAGDNGLYLGREQDANSTARGLYFSSNAGGIWNRVVLFDSAVPASVSSVIYNPNQGGTGTFYAFIRRHGLYSSTDGQHFSPIAVQPTAGLASANCPANSNAVTCLIYRGEIAVVPGRNEMYVWIVDVQPDINGNPAPVDEGIWRSTNGGSSWTRIPDNGITNCGDSAFGPANSGCGVEQGYYNLALAAIPDGDATDIYAGAVNLYKCTLFGNTTCTQGDWINLTHVYGCNPGPLASPAHVHPDQHAIAFAVASGKSPGYFAHDGGISRTLDGYIGLNTGSCSGTNQLDSLSETLGSMTEFVSFSLHPTDANILLGGTQDNGSPKTARATGDSAWQNALGGDGGFNAINPANASEWFAATPYLRILKCELGTACNDTDFQEAVGPPNLGGDEGAFYTPYILDPQNTNEMLVGTCRVWRVSTSGGAPLQLSDDFETLGTGVCTGGEVNLVNALAAGGPTNGGGDSSVVYAVTNGYGPLSGAPGGEVWVTTNAGVTLMTDVTGTVNPQGYAISSVAMDKSDTTGGTAYVGIMGFNTASYPTSHVWKTTNAGASWRDWTGTTALPDAPVNALLVDSNAALIYAGTDVGVFVSSTIAPAWTEAGPAPTSGASGFLPDAPVTALQVFDDNAGTKMLVASTYGRGIWNYALSPNFAITVEATPSSVFTNQTVTWNGRLTALDGYTGTVTLACSAGRPGTCGVTNSTVIPTPAGVPFTITLGNSMPGTFNFTIHATDGTLTHATPTETLTVILRVPDFAISVTPVPNTALVNQNISWNGTLTSIDGYARTVTLSCIGNFPPTCSISPTTVTPTTAGAPFAVTLGSATASTFNFAIQATDGTLTRATPSETLTVSGSGTGIAWTNTGNTSVTALAGQTASYAFSAAPVGSSTFGAAVNFACNNLPALTSCQFNPASIGAGARTTAVTLLITTKGPNFGVQSSRREAPLRQESGPHILALFTIGWVVLLGIVGCGRTTSSKTRLAPRCSGVFLAICVGLGLSAQFSCGGLASSGTITPPPPVTVTVNPGLATLFANEAGNSWAASVNQQQFAATVNAANNQSVTWTVAGGSANGTIDASGLYTPPANIPNPATVTINATSSAAIAPGSAYVTVAPATPLGTSQVTVTATATGGIPQAAVVTLNVR
jgi:hypothetical protein